MQFELVSPFKISSGQEEAVDKLVDNYKKKKNKLF
jgi:excinuclease UvrABC helicase subunit UvrB